jgi:F-type H+-transporting ATPase subunit delta
MNINNLRVLCTSVPGRYATALFNESKNVGCLEEVDANFQKLEGFLMHNEQIAKLLTGSCINSRDLDSGWSAVASHLSFCQIFASFLKQLGRNKRFKILGGIKYIYNVILKKYKNERDVVVTSAIEISPDQQARIEKVVGDMFVEKVLIVYKTDPRIVGGIKISSEERIFDASILAQLRRLVRFLEEAKIS